MVNLRCELHLAPSVLSAKHVLNPALNQSNPDGVSGYVHWLPRRATTRHWSTSTGVQLCGLLLVCLHDSLDGVLVYIPVRLDEDKDEERVGKR